MSVGTCALCVQELSAEGDQGSLYYVARALARLQAQFGAIPRLKGKGAGAAAVRGMLARMRREQGAAAPAAGAGPATALVHPGQGLGAAKGFMYLIAPCDSQCYSIAQSMRCQLLWLWS